MSDKQPITLYGVMSPNVVKVVIMLEELGLEYALRPVSLFKGEQFTPEFLALNPLGKVPVITAPSLAGPLAESGAILIWLAEQNGALLPKEGGARYEVFQWLMVQMAAIGPMLGQYTHFRLLPPGSEPYALGRYGEMAKRLYAKIDERVTDREWMAGGAYSIADVAIFPWAEYLERHSLNIEDYPAMKRWREKIAARPAVIRAKERAVAVFVGPSVSSVQDASPQDLDRFFGRSDAMPAQDFSLVKQMK